MNRQEFLRTCAVAGLLPVLPACSQGQTDAGWVFEPKNPVLGGALGVCFDPYVIKSGSMYKMWFSWRSLRAIGYTESNNGTVWNSPEVVLRPNGDVAGQTDVNRQCVVVRDGTYHMWFTGQTNRNSEIYYATGKDGKHWIHAGSGPVLSPATAWEKTSIMSPNVLWDAKNSRFRMYYSAGEQYEPDAIGFAVSKDGIDWQRNDMPIFTADSEISWERAKVTACDVHQIDGWYYMFYIGFADVDHANIGIARSRNGITEWQRHPKNPILRAPGMLNPFAWDRDAVYKPSAVLEEDGWKLFFNARRQHIEQIGLATHAGRDLGF